MSGKAYISLNKATTNAENAPRERQSREFLGFAKLKAKMMKTSEFSITRDHSPYDGMSATTIPSGVLAINSFAL